MNTFEDAFNNGVFSQTQTGNSFPEFPASPFANILGQNETGFYKDGIDFQKLITKFRQSSHSFSFDYNDFVAPVFYTETNPGDGTESLPVKRNISFFVRDNETGTREIFLTGKLNKELGIITKTERKFFFKFELETGKYAQYIKRVRYTDSDEIAIELIASSYEDYDIISNEIGAVENAQVKNTIFSTFNQAFRNTGDDIGNLKWLYEQAPQFVTKQFSNNRLIKDLKLLVSYDQDGALSWFKDSSSAVINLLTSFSNVQFLYDYFIENPEKVIDIYRGLQGDSVAQFTSLLTSLTHLFAEIDSSIVNKPIFTIGKNYSLNSNIFIDDNAKNILLEGFKNTFIETTKQKTNNSGLYRNIDIFEDIKIEQQSNFHPLDIVYLQNEESGNTYPVCALQVKYLSDTQEWDEVITATVIIVNIIGIIVSAGLLSAGATGIVGIIAAADIIVSTIDIAIITRSAKLKGTEEGAWLDKNWDAISVSFAALSIGTALRQGLLENGPKVLSKLRGSRLLDAGVVRDRIRLLLFQATFNIEIANFGSTTFKIASIAEIAKSSIKNSINADKLERLWKLGAVILKGEGKADNYYGLLYKGEVIFSGETKQIEKLFDEKILKYGTKDDSIIKYFDELFEIEKIGIKIKNGNYFWKNNLGTKLRWAKLPEKTIINNIDIKINNSLRKGDVFEGEVGREIALLAEKFGDEITDFSNDVKNIVSKQKNGDIDVATKKYIFEVKTQLHNNHNIEKLKIQLQKYLPKNANSSNEYMNPLNKMVVVVYRDLGNFTLNNAILKELSNDGVIFIEGINDIKKIY